MKSPINNISIAVTASVMAISGFTHTTLAQSAALEEVIVTASKRAENLQELPVTVTAFSSAAIEEAGIYSADDVAILTPALTINTNLTPFDARMNIRGIGTAQRDPALEPSVGLFVDGMFFGRTGLGMADLTDIERIEVLQGPQGTLYGKNTNAGAISIVTKAPNQEDLEGSFEASRGNYGLDRYTGVLSGPITDRLAFRVSGNIHQQNGFYENAAGADLNAVDDWNLQGKLLWQLTDDLDVTLSASRVKRDTTCCGADSIQSDSVNDFLAANGMTPDANDPYDYQVSVDVPSKFEMSADTVMLTVNYSGAAGDLTSITGWNDYGYVMSTDPDRSELDILPLIDDTFGGDSVSQELRWTSSIGDRVDYQVGGFYLDQTTERGGEDPFVFVGDDLIPIGSQQPLPFPVPLPFLVQPGDNLTVAYSQNTETIALFGQATWHATDRLHVTAGLRWSEEEKTADLYSQTFSTAISNDILGASFLDSVSTPIDTTLSRKVDNTDWMLRAAFDLTDDIMLFASAATGTKSGGFNSVNGTEEQRAFDDEDTTSVEVGIKTTLLDSKLRLNATWFDTDIDGYQSNQQLPTGLGTYVSNEAKVETSGLDLQLEALPAQFLRLSAGLLYMNDYDITEGPSAGYNLPFTAELSVNLGATVFVPIGQGTGYWRTDYSYMDDHTTTASVALAQENNIDNRTLLNSRIGWRTDHWDVALWGKNLTDDNYASLSALPFLLSGMEAFFLAPPRTYGVTLRYSF
ncbi:MAG: TonB-dependent receptor [Halieaceae bacterium]